MLHILLTILKVIGIILLVIIGLIIFLVVCILFVPIRYGADISYDKKLRINIKATYLLSLIYFKYEWGDNSQICLRICGIKTHFLDKDRKEKNKKYDEDTEMFERMSDEIKKNDITDNSKELKKINNKRDELAEKAGNLSGEDVAKDKNNDYDRGDKRESFIEKIIKRIKVIIGKIKFRFKQICGTIKKVCRKSSDFKDFITDETTKEAYYFVKKEVFALLKHIRPRRIKGYVHYGFDDPSVTGKVLGLIYMLSSGTHKNFQINADFEDKVLEGEVHFRGYVQVYVLLIIVWRLYRNENLKEVLERRRTYGRE